MFIRGPKLGQLEERADVISRQVDLELESVTSTVIDWFRSFDDINIARSLWVERVNASLLPLVMKAYNDSADNTWEKLTAVEDNAAPALTAALIPRVISDRAEEFFIGARRRLTAIGDMLWNAMRTELLVGMQFGDAVPALRERIGSALKLTAPRARNIATTEVLGASQAGSFHQVKAAKVVALKRWITKDDDRVRQSHRDVNEVQIAADAKFIVGGFAMDYPHDPTAPLEETINCRCTLVWNIVEKDELSDELVIQSLAADAFHLPGKHDQKTHGRRGGKNARNATTPPKLKVAPQLAENAMFASSSEPWVFNDDPDKRAVGIWASSFNGMDAVRQVFRNRAAGRPDFADFEFSSKRFNFTVLKMPEYTEQDLRNDVLASAMRLQERLDAAPTNKTRLYRGMRLSRDSIPSPGDTFDQDIASWTADKDWASVYASTEDAYHKGDIQVIMRLEGSHRSVDINSDLPSFMYGSQEHLAGGRYRVKAVTGSGRKRTVVVEEVPDETT